MDLVKRSYVPANTTGSRAILIVAYLMAGLSVILVGSRFFARRVQRLSYALDDWLILIALPVVLGHVAIIASSVYLGGVGHRQATLQPQNSVALYQTLTALQFSFGVSLGLIKASILFLLMRIFTTKKFKLVARIVLAYVVCWAIMCILIGSAMCRPFRKNWDPSVPGVCGERMSAYIAIAATDIAGDLMIVALPMSNIWHLHTNLKLKIALSVIFAIGLLDVIVGVLRIVYLVDLAKASDYTYTAVNCWIWSTLEPALALFVACLPTLKPLVKVAKERMNSTAGLLSSRYNNISKELSDHKPSFGSQSLDVTMTSESTEHMTKDIQDVSWSNRQGQKTTWSDSVSREHLPSNQSDNKRNDKDGNGQAICAITVQREFTITNCDSTNDKTDQRGPNHPWENRT